MIRLVSGPERTFSEQKFISAGRIRKNHPVEGRGGYFRGKFHRRQDGWQFALSPAHGHPGEARRDRTRFLNGVRSAARAV